MSYIVKWPAVILDDEFAKDMEIAVMAHLNIVSLCLHRETEENYEDLVSR
jgi:hypothetical protein